MCGKLREWVTEWVSVWANEGRSSRCVLVVVVSACIGYYMYVCCVGFVTCVLLWYTQSVLCLTGFVFSLFLLTCLLTCTRPLYTCISDLIQCAFLALTLLKLVSVNSYWVSLREWLGWNVYLMHIIGNGIKCTFKLNDMWKMLRGVTNTAQVCVGTKSWPTLVPRLHPLRCILAREGAWSLISRDLDST